MLAEVPNPRSGGQGNWAMKNRTTVEEQDPCQDMTLQVGNPGVVR